MSEYLISKVKKMTDAASKGEILLKSMLEDSGCTFCIFFLDDELLNASIELFPKYKEKFRGEERLLLLFSNNRSSQKFISEIDIQSNMVCKILSQQATQNLLSWCALHYETRKILIISIQKPYSTNANFMLGKKGISYRDIVYYDLYKLDKNFQSRQMEPRFHKVLYRRCRDSMWMNKLLSFMALDIIKKVCRYGKAGKTIFLMRGATGDAYYALCLLPAYLKKHKIRDYVIVGDSKNLVKIAKLFHEKVIPINKVMAGGLQNLFKIMGQELKIVDLFLWQYSMNYNRCRVRMLPQFNFMDTYQYYVFGFDSWQPLKIPLFAKTTEMEVRWRNWGVIPGKTIIISPQASSVIGLSEHFWIEVHNVLASLGFTVLFNLPENKWFKKTKIKKVMFNYGEGVSLLSYAGFFIGVRSGLCDIVSSTFGKMIILYPKRMQKLNYSVHRSDIDFCGLSVMGVNKNAAEISTSLLSDVADRGVAVLPEHIQKQEEQTLLELILREVVQNAD